MKWKLPYYLTLNYLSFCVCQYQTYLKNKDSYFPLRQFLQLFSCIHLKCPFSYMFQWGCAVIHIRHPTAHWNLLTFYHTLLNHSLSVLLAWFILNIVTCREHISPTFKNFGCLQNFTYDLRHTVNYRHSNPSLQTGT